MSKEKSTWDREESFRSLSAEALLQWAADQFNQGMIASTSFGIQSAVTLDLIHRHAPETPIIFVDTGYLFEETYQYAEQLTRRFDLNLHVYESRLRPREMEIKLGRLWESDDVRQLDLYDQIRKVEPMRRAIAEHNATAWISGLRREQTQHRSKLPRVKLVSGQYRVYPILDWSAKQVYHYMQEHDLPQHPLFEKGYTTVGDVHSSRPITLDDLNERDTRFQGKKQECGLHL